MVSIADVVFAVAKLILNLWVVGSTLLTISLLREFGVGEKKLTHPWVWDIVIIVLIVVLIVLLAIR